MFLSKPKRRFIAELSSRTCTHTVYTQHSIYNVFLLSFSGCSPPSGFASLEKLDFLVSFWLLLKKSPLRLPVVSEVGFSAGVPGTSSLNKQIFSEVPPRCISNLQTGLYPAHQLASQNLIHAMDPSKLAGPPPSFSPERLTRRPLSLYH